MDAAGAWAAASTRLPVAVPVEPVRGQIVEIRLAGRPLETVVSSEEVYVVPRPDGTALLGSTIEHVGFRKDVTAGAVERLIAAARASRARDRLGPLRDGLGGLRPGTPDGCRCWGRLRSRGSVFAAGHFRSGILLAPSTARRMADLLTGRSSAGTVPVFGRAFRRPADASMTFAAGPRRAGEAAGFFG